MAIVGITPLVLGLVGLEDGPYYLSDAWRLRKDQFFALYDWVLRRMAPYGLAFGIPDVGIGLVRWLLDHPDAACSWG